MNTTTSPVPQWFVLSAVYGRELKLLELLRSRGFQAFVPMHQVMRRDTNGKNRRTLEPVVKNWVFVKAEKPELEYLKSYVLQKYNWTVCFLTKPVRVPDYSKFDSSRPDRKLRMLEKKEIITISDEDMEPFIRICEEMAGEVIYFTPEEVDLSKGDRVRIIGGTFNGMEGHFLKVKGKRSRRFVVSLPQMLMASTANIEPQFVQIIEKASKKKP